MRGETLNEQEYDKELDHLVDVRNVSYDEARQILGPPPYELQVVREPVDIAALYALAKNRSRQRAINKKGITKVRAALRERHTTAA